MGKCQVLKGLIVLKIFKFVGIDKIYTKKLALTQKAIRCSTHQMAILNLYTDFNFKQTGVRSPYTLLENKKIHA